MQFGTDQDIPNCRCNEENCSFFLVKGLRFLFPDCSPCWRALEWEKKCEIPNDYQSVYGKLVKSGENYQSADVHQIDLDLNRTFPTTKLFGSDTKLALRRVLISISLFEPAVGYVQGMNFLAGSIMWHTTESKSFWFMINLLRKYEMRRNFLPGLPGLAKHSQILELLLFEQYPNFFCYLNEHRADVSVYITEWCFTLFAKIVPIYEMGMILHGFFLNGWVFFYKVVLAIIFRLKEKLLCLRDPADILTIIKPSEVYKKGRTNFIKSLSAGSENLTWAELLNEAENINLDKDYIEFLISNI